MVTAAPIFKTRDGQIEPFMSPTFRVEIGPSLGALQTVWDVSRVSYRDAINQIDSIDLTVNNSGWNRGEPAYTAKTTAAGKEVLILPGQYVRLWLGYNGPTDLYPMLTGRVTSVTPNFSGDRGLDLTVRALSSLEALRKAPVERRWPPSKKLPAMKDSDIAKQIAQDNKIQIVIPAGLQQAEAAEPNVLQANVTDIAFLIQRAKRRGYIVCFRENLGTRSSRGAARQAKASVQPEKIIYFGPSDLLKDNESTRMGDRKQRLELSWGKSLIDFRPTMNMSTTLWNKVEVSFWDRRAKKKQLVKYELTNLWSDEKGVNQDLEPLLKEAGLGETKLTAVACHTVGQAKDLARNTLRENFLQLVTAEGSCVGQPEIRSCSRIEVKGVGAPFSGTYFVTGTTHTIDDNGYRTQFSCRREQPTRGS